MFVKTYLNSNFMLELTIIEKEVIYEK